MQLGEPPADVPPIDLDTHVGAILDRRLAADTAQPLAVALSGGGDSLALLLAAAAWAKRARRRLLVLTVDHQLRPVSAEWTQVCASVAARLGADFHSLTWEGAKPTAGLPAAARLARHRLLADAAREAGANVILMGHTADDVGEARIMRQAGASTPEPHEWGPSPVWPQGRGVFLLRPLLAVRRAAIRGWLSERRETWIDDPANDDLAYARPRARAAISGAILPEDATARPDCAPLARAVRPDGGGGFSIPRSALRKAPHAAVQRFVAAACLCAAGSDRPPTRERVRSLTHRLLGAETFTATLAGARIEADAVVAILREPGEAARGGLAPLQLKAGELAVWDGRFEVRAESAVEVRALGGLSTRLSPEDQAWRLGRPAAARAALPAVVDETGHVRALVGGGLTHARLLAACGVIDREPVSA